MNARKEDFLVLSRQFLMENIDVLNGEAQLGSGLLQVTWMMSYRLYSSITWVHIILK